MNLKKHLCYSKPENYRENLEALLHTPYILMLVNIHPSSMWVLKKENSINIPGRQNLKFQYSFS